MTLGRIQYWGASYETALLPLSLHTPAKNLSMLFHYLLSLGLLFLA